MKKISGIAFVNRIDGLCSVRGMNRKTLCETLGILQGTMATWKTKDIMPPVYTIVKIADFFDISLDFLITGEEHTNKESDISILKKNMKNALRNSLEILEEQIEALI